MDYDLGKIPATNEEVAMALMSTVLVVQHLSTALMAAQLGKKNVVIEKLDEVQAAVETMVDQAERLTGLTLRQ